MVKQPVPEEIYNRTTCQRCGKEVSKERIEDCKKRRFWPVCEECEKIIIPKYKKAIELLKEKGMRL